MRVETCLRNWSKMPAMLANLLIGWGMFVAASTASGASGTSGTSASEQIHALFDEYWEDRLERYPTWATYLGDHRYDDRLEDLSESADRELQEALTGFLERARTIDASTLSEMDRVSAELFTRILEEDLASLARHDGWMPIQQVSGIHISFPELVATHPFDTVAACDDYVARLRAFPEQVDQVIERMRQGMAAGLVPYRGNVEGALEQVDRLAVGPAASHPVYPPDDAIGLDIEPAEVDRIRIAIELAIDAAVLPAYRKLGAFLRAEYLPECRGEPSVGALPDGAARYAELAREYTTTDLGPREIHEIGLREVVRIRAEMDEIRRRVAFDGDLAAFFEHLRTDPSFYYDTADALIEGFRTILDRMDAKLPELFGRLPEAPYDLREMEAFRAEAAPAAYYYPPPDDGSRPGYFYVNTHDLSSRPRYTMEALAYHEAVPGHHLQIALQQQLDLPDFRRHAGFTAFVEGWALYSERLPKEVGLYEDPYSDFGRLTFDMWRACRLVVDTGIHAFGWSRDQAIAYLAENSALARHDIDAEVDRYIAWPGQALAYKIGQLRILELRGRAETALGERFDLREFHDVLLESGAVPLDALEGVVDRWIEDASVGGAARANP